MTLSSCNSTISYTIDFDSNGGADVSSVETGGSSVITMPDNPTKEGFLFDGWYWDNNTFERPFTANSLLELPLSSNVTVYAKWFNEDDANALYLILVEGAILYSLCEGITSFTMEDLIEAQYIVGDVFDLTGYLDAFNAPLTITLADIYITVSENIATIVCSKLKPGTFLKIYGFDILN